MVEPFVVHIIVASVCSTIGFKVTSALIRRRQRKQQERLEKMSPAERLEKYAKEMRKKDPVFAVQNPETEELREIYRQLDEELMLADEVKTPPPPRVLSLENLMPSWARPRKDTGKPRPGTVVRKGHAVPPPPRDRKGHPHPDNLMIGKSDALAEYHSRKATEAEERKRKLMELVRRKEG